MAEPLAVYIHWPYCARICPYCDFNVYKRRDDPILLDAIVKDLEQWRADSGARDIRSIHFGGGTPSLLSGGEVETLIAAVSRLWGPTPDTEIAIEANPTELDRDRWADYARAGVTRLSLGVQSFNSDALAFLGRDHDGTQAALALDAALEIFPSVSADLIFGWAGQTTAQLEADLAQLIGSGVPHISTYQLTIEDGTAFARAEERGQTRAVGEETSADFYDLVRTRLTGAGFAHYEVSNFARPGHASRHNLAYWQAVDYVGAGPGAHGRITLDGRRVATVAHLRPDAYAAAVAQTGSGIDTREIMSPAARAEEYVLMGLRITEGLSLSHYASLRGAEMNAEEIAALCEAGLLHRRGDRLCATASGRLVLNALTDRLLLNQGEPDG